MTWIEDYAGRSAWHRVFAAFAFGFAGALAFPPTGFFPILAVSFPALIILLRTAPNDRAAFATGWSFAFGYFLLGLYWTAAAMFVDIRQFWWAVPLAAAGLPAMCAFYYGFAAILARRLGLQGISGALCMALCWFLADYARGHVLTGFPWNLEGYAWSNLLPVMQSVSLFGIYGLTLITLVVACLPVALAGKSRSGNVAVILGLAVVALLTGWGSERLSSATEPPTATRIRVVQPNVEQSKKWDKNLRDVNFQRLLDYTGAPADKVPDLVVWPETASTFYLTEDAEHRRAIAASLQMNSYVVTGVIRRFVGSNEKINYANSMVALDRTSRIATIYDKFHLVPFGEYIPLRRILALPTLANLGVDFTAGPGLRTLHIPGLPPFSPLICYEAIFPGEVALRHDRPQFLVNITNDGWYGRTAGPYQHFASARTRAIEEGLPLVRSANTGISGVIDAYGRITAEMGLGERGFVDADLPQAISPTFYSRYGDRPLGVLFVVFAGLSGVLRLIGKRR